MARRERFRQLTRCTAGGNLSRLFSITNHANVYIDCVIETGVARHDFGRTLI